MSMTFSVRTHMQTFFGCIDHSFCHLKQDVVLLPPSKLSNNERFTYGIVVEGNKTTILRKIKCSYLVLSMFVSVSRSVRHHKPSSLRFFLWNYFSYSLNCQLSWTPFELSGWWLVSHNLCQGCARHWNVRWCTKSYSRCCDRSLLQHEPTFPLEEPQQFL